MPTPIKKGKFSLFETPDGGFHIAYVDEMDENAETQHIEIPGHLVKMAKMMGDGKIPNPFGAKAKA